MLELLRRRTLELARRHGLSGEPLEVVSARALTPEEAIGTPERSDFPILKGKESMMEARFRGNRGQAFTSMPGDFRGTLEEVTDWADVVLATGTALANDTIDGLISGKPIIFYGVTIAGAASLLGYERYCPCSC